MKRLCALLIAAAVLGLFMAGPSHARTRYDHSLYRCKDNLSTLWAALEKYANDHGDRYPKLLSELAPTYVGRLPSCPSVGANTYSCGYVTRAKGYSLCCFGANHHGLPANSPSIDSQTGYAFTPQPSGQADEEKMELGTAAILLAVLCFLSYLIYRKR